MNDNDPIEKATNKIWADEYINRDQVADAIREAVEAETAKLKADRDEWHATALEYARSSDAAHNKLHNMQNDEKCTFNII